MKELDRLPVQNTRKRMPTNQELKITNDEDSVEASIRRSPLPARTMHFDYERILESLDDTWKSYTEPTVTTYFLLRASSSLEAFQITLLSFYQNCDNGSSAQSTKDNPERWGTHSTVTNFALQRMFSDYEDATMT